jgi:hypothetical protein
MKTITAPQARLIAQTLEALDPLPFYADGQYLRVALMDELFEDPIGYFTNEEGAWFFEVREEPARKPATVEEIAQILFDSNREHYRDRKIGFIKELREQWNLATGMTLSLVDSKNAVEKVLSDDALARLREKLTTPSFPDPSDNTWALDQAEDRAYAEHRERIAERGTWFGAPGPLDEEPF